MKPSVLGSYLGTVSVDAFHGDVVFVESAGGPSLARVFGLDACRRATIVTFDLTTGREVARAVTGDGPRGEFTADGRHLVTFGGGGGRGEPFVAVWDAETLERRWQVALPSGWEPVSCIAGDSWFAVRTMSNRSLLARVDDPDGALEAIHEPLARKHVPESIAPGDRFLLVRDLDARQGEYALLDPATREERPLPVPSRVRDTYFLTDGTIVVSSFDHPSLVFLDDRGNTLSTRKLPGPYTLLTAIHHGALVTSPKAFLVVARDRLVAEPCVSPLSVSEPGPLALTRSGDRWLRVEGRALRLGFTDGRRPLAWDTASPAVRRVVFRGAKLAVEDVFRRVRDFDVAGNASPGAAIEEGAKRGPQLESAWDGDRTNYSIREGRREAPLDVGEWTPIAHRWMDQHSAVCAVTYDRGGERVVARARIDRKPAPCLTILEVHDARPVGEWGRTFARAAVAPDGSLVFSCGMPVALRCVAPDGREAWRHTLGIDGVDEIIAAASGDAADAFVATRGGTHVFVHRLGDGACVLDLDLEAADGGRESDAPHSLALAPPELAVGTYRGVALRIRFA